MRSYVRTKGAGLLVTVGDNDYSGGEQFERDWSSAFGWTNEEEIGVAGALGNHDVTLEKGRYEFDLLGMPGPYYRRSFGSADLFVVDSKPASRRRADRLAEAGADRVVGIVEDRRLPSSCVHLRRVLGS